MLNHLRSGCQLFWQWVYGLDKGEWLMLLIVATVVGFMLLQGFGSRSTR